MRCQYCGTDRDLITEKHEDEDGFMYDSPIDLCHNCVEVAVERSKARNEWVHYHPGEPCPEIELPQPAPNIWKTQKEQNEGDE